ncbi:hypothetical protein AB1680_30320 [Pseudomonas antarctica]
MDRIDAYRIVTYQRKAFGHVFKGDDVVYQGLIVHEARGSIRLPSPAKKMGLATMANPAFSNSNRWH